MRKFTVVEEARMTDTAESSFMDTCDIYIASGYQDSTGQEIITYPVTYSGAECGFHPTASRTIYRGQTVVPEYDAECRLSLDQEIHSKDKITVSGIDFEVEGINTGRTCKVTFLRLMDV